VAIDRDEAELGRARVRATRKQVPQLLHWAEPLGERTWAIESAGGLGYLLAQQLVAAGETVLDVPATLASRIQVLGRGRSDKNDPNDALSVAIAALRVPALREVVAADHAQVLRLSRSATSTSATTGPGSCAGSTTWSWSSHLAGSPKNSTLLTPSRSSSASSRPHPSRSPDEISRSR
jgi:hypothetical protein